DPVHDREHLIPASAAEVKLASLADDARLETDRLLVVVDRERAEVFARDDLFRGAVLLADRDLDVSLDVDLLHLDRLLRNLEIHGRGLVCAWADDTAGPMSVGPRRSAMTKARTVRCSRRPRWLGICETAPFLVGGVTGNRLSLCRFWGLESRQFIAICPLVGFWDAVLVRSECVKSFSQPAI